MKVRQNIKTSANEGLEYYELKQNEQLPEEQCSKLAKKRNQDKLHWLQNQNKIEIG